MKNQVKLYRMIGLWLALGISSLGLGTATAGLFGTDYNNIEYLCCDWGPAMTLPAKTNDVAQFNDAENEVYFLKQVFSFTRKKRLAKDVWSGRDHEDVGRGLSIYLCKMKADGSAKTEIKELWKNPAYPIDTQGQSTWLDVNRKTRKIALSITFAGSDITGLWTMNLDGGGLKRVITPDCNTNYLQAINHVSWTPDGQWLFFEEELRGMNPNRFNIARCDAAGSARRRIFEATAKIQYRQPSVSPDGKQLAYLRMPYGFPGALLFGFQIWTAQMANLWVERNRSRIVANTPRGVRMGNRSILAVIVDKSLS